MPGEPDLDSSARRLAVTVRCQTTFEDLDVPEVPIAIRLPATVQDLIGAAVHEQLAALRIRVRRDGAARFQALARLYLLDEEVAAQARTGKVAWPGEGPADPPSEEKAVAAALRALARGTLTVLVDGVALREAHAPIPPDARDAVFLRLVLLQGG